MPNTNAEASSSKRQNKPYSKGNNNSKQKNGHQPPKRNADSTKLGVSKIKSMIRQASRLLQKEGIEPGLKVQTERRLESLKADLRRAELNNVEKKNHERYHMAS
jgi:vacuolar-type H+-ATPase subunit I/STV1